MNGRTELLAYLGAAIATTIGLFTLQAICVSYIDVNVVHASFATAPQDSKIAAKRAEEAQKLSAGAMPIERAIEALSQRGRAVSNKIAPAQSTDLSAMSGWIHRHGFAPYVPKAPPPVAAAPAAVAPVEGTPAAEGAAPAAAPAAAKPATAKPATAAPATAAPAHHEVVR